MSRPDWGVGGRGPCARDATTALVYTNLLRSHRRDVGVLHVEVLLEGHQLVLAPVDLAEPGAGPAAEAIICGAKHARLLVKARKRR